jgi:hypothetical protein
MFFHISLNLNNIGTASISSFKLIKINLKAEIEIAWNIDIDNFNLIYTIPQKYLNN